MSDELLRIEDLSIDLPIGGEPRTVVSELSLAIGAGEAVGMVGESGSGKSMTAKAIIGLLPRGARTSGKILFDGTDVLGLRGAELRRYRAQSVAMVFQDPRAAINPVRTIDDFMTEALRDVRGMAAPAARAKAVELLTEVSIGDPERVLTNYPHELSGGMLQRVMIAAMVAQEPRLLLADEPTTALDVTTQAEVITILARLREQHGMALLFITHDLDLAGAICDRTAVMYAGGIVEEQGSAEINEHPRHPYSAALLRCRPSLSQQGGRLAAIEGQPVAAFEAPAGCRFAPRCEYAQDACRVAVPALRPVGGAMVACIRAEELGPLTLLDDTPVAINHATPRQPAEETTPESAATQALVTVTDLRKEFALRGGGRFAAVEGLSFTVKAGGSLAIVGESGAGKSTVARMLMGLERPTNGTIMAMGEDRSGPAHGRATRLRRASQIQMVFQDPYLSLDPRQRVGEVLDESLRLHKRMTRDERRTRVAELLEVIGMSARPAASVPAQLSGGQRQRVAIARALAAEPRLIILDEAVSALDVSMQAQILNLLTDIRERTGVAYILISHDLGVVNYLTEAIIVMRRGEVVEAGDTGTIVTAPTEPYTQRLLACVPRPGWTPPARQPLALSPTAPSA